LAEGETVFSKIVRGDIPCSKVYEDDQALAFRDIAPCAPTHVLVIPKQPVESLLDVTAQNEALMGHLLFVAAEVARIEGLAESGFRVIINNGRAAGQEVPHVHLHVVGGRPFGWPPL
jgi:histidine triad (HIT) family protein